MYSISILTPCLNPEKQNFIDLASSIAIQSNLNYEWLILDGGSNYYLKKFIREYCTKLNLDIKFINLPESSIYSALNYGIRNCKYDYYLTMGCDDKLDKDAFKNLFNLFPENIDFAIANVVKGSKIMKSHKNHPKLINLYGATKLITNHSVGCIIRKSLHYDLGFYSTSYKYLSDSEFLIKAYFKKYNFKYLNFVIGEVGNEGVTSRKRLNCIIEHYRIIKKLKPIILFDEIFFILRILKFKFNFFTIIKNWIG